MNFAETEALGGSREELVESLLREIVLVKRRLELSLLQGDYDALLEVARDIILLELKARRIGVYVDVVERELLRVKEVFATAVATASSTGVVGARSVKKRARLRVLVAGRGVVSFEFGGSWGPPSSKRK